MRSFFPSFLPKVFLTLAFVSKTTSGEVSWVNTAAPPFYEVSGHTGGFTTGLPIAVPSFRGLEPSIALSYGSFGQNGFAGVGWEVSGFDLIERKNKDGGWPRFDSTDTYWWGGQKLVPCGTSASPGCDAGGTHFTESETYARVIDNGDDTWTVTGKSGTQSAYTVMGYTGTKKFRYGLSSVEDVLGNTVSYTWSCASATDHCYPTSIEYNGASVTFYRETRPDPITSPGNIVQSQRLKTIEVEVSSSRVRAYQLLYETSPTTSRSLLSSFQMYGTDAVLDGSGTVTGGTSLPPTTFAYRGDAQAASFTGGGVWATGACDSGIAGTQLGSGDFNGDGLSDLYCHWDAPGNAFDTQIAFANASGSFGAPQLVVNDWCHLTYAAMDIGDFNGDGFLDFACQSKVIPRNTYVALNDGDGTFSPPSSWSTTSNWCELDKPSVKWGTADVNGDGKTDVWCHWGQEWGDTIFVGVSTGTSFTESVWANWCWTVNAFFTFGPDVNGDGTSDAICRGASSGFVDLLLSKGTGFYGTTFPTLQYWCGGDLTFGSGDFNGDGKADLWCRQPTDTPDRVKGVYVALSTGESWTGWTSSTDTTAAPNWCATQQIGTGDFNGDGRSDFSCHNLAGSNETWVRLSKDRVAGLTPEATWKSGWCAGYEQAGDFNGDGKTDLLCHSGTTSKVAVSGALRGKTDVLAGLTGSLAGTTSVTYTPSSDWDNTNGPPVRETVTSVSVADGRGWSSTTSYTYAGGLFDAAKGRDLGFGYSKVTFPKLATETLAPYAESWFSQTIASAGALTKSERRDGAGKIFHKSENTITIDGDGTTEPYRARITLRWSYVFDGTVTGCGSWPCTNGERRYEEYDYDDWGNTVETRSWGNYDVSGDETTSVAEFYPNSSTYVTNRTARQASHVGIGMAGTKLTESRIFYDGATLHTVSPTQGLLTKTSVWRNTDNQFVPQCNLASCVQYDLFGNVTQTTDVKGGQTTLAYDTTYHLFPASTTNALGHIATSTWNYACEGMATATNPNNQTATTTYDVFCRHDRTDGPLGSFADSLYQNLGNPGTQYVEVKGPSPSGSGVAWARTYVDGLARTYKRQAVGPSLGFEILSGEVTFNERGGVLTSTAPRFYWETAQVTSYEYDALDRLKKTTLPDLNTVTQSYGLRETYVTNPEGDITGEARNETGLVRYVIEYLGATSVITSITTNLSSRTKTTQDYQGNVWLAQLNSLGQVTSASDPDSGTETREYNSAGELTAAVNSLAERTELAYDLLSRMLTKTTRAGTGNAQVTTFNYDQPRTGYFNKGFQTTMTDVAGTLKSDFDALGRPARSERTIDGVPYTSTSAYNTAGLPASTTYPDNQSISWSYDAVGNLSTETGTITASTYDAAGRLKSRNFTGNVVTTYNYSPTRGWVENINTVKNSTVHQNLVYTYYPDGMIQTVTSPKSMESWSYAYDDLNRLLTGTNADTPSLTQSFTYNEIGNLTYNSQIGTYTYPNPGTARPHAVSTAGSRTYQYNAAGQMTSRNGTVIQWNGDGKPSSIGNIAFTYDGVGTRLKKTSSGQTTKYLGGDYEIAPDGTVTKYLVGGKKVGAVFYKHHRDHLGSIQAVTNWLGNEVRRQKHKPFGDQHYVSGSHAESKGWIGEREEETELIYLNARYYDPEIGRFTAPDPIVRLGQGLNRFAYSHNDCINFLDPSGLCEISISCSGGRCGPSSMNALIEIGRCIFEFVTWLIGGPPSMTRPNDVPPNGQDFSLDGNDTHFYPEDYNPEWKSPGSSTDSPPSDGPPQVPPEGGPLVPPSAPSDDPLNNCQDGSGTNCPGGAGTGPQEAPPEKVRGKAERQL